MKDDVCLMLGDTMEPAPPPDEFVQALEVRGYLDRTLGAVRGILIAVLKELVGETAPVVVALHKLPLVDGVQAT